MEVDRRLREPGIGEVDELLRVCEPHETSSAGAPEASDATDHDLVGVSGQDKKAAGKKTV